MSENQRRLVLFQGVAGRRSVLKWSGMAFVGALALSSKLPGFSIAESFAETRGGEKAVDLGEGDIGILNYAYALEQLEAAFYTQVTKSPYDNMESADRDILTGIRDHEIAHRDFLKVALKKQAIPELEPDFSKVDFRSRDSVLNTAETFENLGVAAYNGAGHLLKKEEYLLVAGKIVSVEARHAAAIHYLLRSTRQVAANNNNGNTTGQADHSRDQQTADASPVNDKGLDQALAPADVLPKAAPFIKTKISADHLG